ncbi:MAG: (Fe-S)-binding protein, partial [Thermodesulfobacteriota bacterium]|nr:(Fe-S)-binding protein [Thermodesulfobacteriota bacterium]
MVDTNIVLNPEEIDNFRYDAEKCTGCKGCVWVDHIYMPPDTKFSARCPSYIRYLFDAYAAYGRGKVAIALMEGRMEYTPSVLDIIYRCQLCGACDAGCKRNLDLEPLLMLEALRIKCVQDGKGPLPKHKKVIENMETRHNRYGAPHEDRRKWLPDNISLNKSPKVVYFAGCAASYTHPEIAMATTEILQKAGAEFTVMAEEWCCGCPAYSVGDVEVARK